jgi:hypothetical protein
MPGYFVPTTGQSSETPAPAGYYVPNAGASAATPAMPGYFVPTTGSTQEIPDPPGTTSGVAATTFTPVSPAGPTGGLSKGFWSNKNGQALECQADFATLTSLNLRTTTGAPQVFTSSLDANRKAFAAWLSGASATNMASMLSAQLAATVLSVSHGFVNPTASVNIYLISSAFNTLGSSTALIAALNSGPNPNLVAPNGQLQINALIAAANASLGVSGSTTAQSAARTYQEALKDVLDAINNNQPIMLG